MKKEINEFLETITEPEHPMLKIMKHALEKAKASGKNGNYRVYSDDVGIEETPHLSATAQKQGNSYSFLEVKNISNGTVFSERAVQNIITSEMELSEYPIEVPIADALKIAQKISNKGTLIKLEKGDRKRALENARKVLAKEKLSEIPLKMKREIMNINEWELIGDNAKSFIGMQWAKRLGNNSMVIINDTDTVEKDKLRKLILYIQKDV
ncbi:MAG: hypothetical protein V1836_04465 [Candidatus Aenigmatarchaeota archaeon]